MLNQTMENTIVERTHQLSQANKILSELSVRDPMTQAFNRLYFEQQTERLILNFKASEQTLHLCLFDLDYFKSVNDTYGHVAGDDQLCNTAMIVRSVLDDRCVFSRVGGEEFTILFHNFEDREVYQKIECIRQEMEKQSKANAARTTASFGITRYIMGMSMREFLKAADHNMYEAKHAGRNRIVFEGWSMNELNILR